MRSFPAYCCAAANLAAAVALLTVLAPGTPLALEPARAAYVREHVALWRAGWSLWVVAAVSLLGLSIREAARIVVAGLYGANVVFWGLAVHLLTRRFWAGVLVSAFLLASPVFLLVHDAAMSEPLFLLLALLALSALAAYLHGGRRGFLFLAALGASARRPRRWRTWRPPPTTPCARSSST